jgi:hypothetical protein
MNAKGTVATTLSSARAAAGLPTTSSAAAGTNHNRFTIDFLITVSLSYRRALAS